MKLSQKQFWRIRKRVQRLVPVTKDSYCVECGRKKSLHRHHSDGNILNNDLNNIVILCRRCHIQDHLAMGTWSHGLEWDAQVAAD